MARNQMARNQMAGNEMAAHHMAEGITEGSTEGESDLPAFDQAMVLQVYWGGGAFEK